MTMMLRVFAPINFRTAWRLFFTLTREQSISCGHYGYYPRVNKFTLKMTEVLCKNDISASKDIYKIMKCIELIMYMILLLKKVISYFLSYITLPNWQYQYVCNWNYIKIIFYFSFANTTFRNLIRYFSSFSSIQLVS